MTSQIIVNNYSEWLLHCRLADESIDRSRVADRTLILVRHGQYDLTTGHLTDLGTSLYYNITI